MICGDDDSGCMLYTVMKVLMGFTGYSPVNLQQNIEIWNEENISCIRREGERGQ